MHKSEPAPAAEPAASNVKPAAIYEALAPAFVVNFNQNGRQRYMQVSITLQARNQADLDALKVHMPVIRNNLVMMFSGQGFDTLAGSPVGQEMLRQKATAVVQKWRRRKSAGRSSTSCCSPISYCSRSPQWPYRTCCPR